MCRSVPFCLNGRRLFAPKLHLKLCLFGESPHRPVQLPLHVFKDRIVRYKILSGQCLRVLRQAQILILRFLRCLHDLLQLLPLAPAGLAERVWCRLRQCLCPRFGAPVCGAVREIDPGLERSFAEVVPFASEFPPRAFADIEPPVSHDIRHSVRLLPQALHHRPGGIKPREEHIAVCLRQLSVRVNAVGEIIDHAANVRPLCFRYGEHFEQRAFQLPLCNGR